MAFKVTVMDPQQYFGVLIHLKYYIKLLHAKVVGFYDHRNNLRTYSTVRDTNLLTQDSLVRWRAHVCPRSIEGSSGP